MTSAFKVGVGLLVVGAAMAGQPGAPRYEARQNGDIVQL